MISSMMSLMAIYDTQPMSTTEITTTTTTSTMLATLTSRLNLRAETSSSSTPSPTQSQWTNSGNSNVNSNGVTVNIVAIGVGFVGGAISLIFFTLITRLAIARRRARQTGAPRPEIWDIIFMDPSGQGGQGRLAIGRSLGGWDYGIDIWSVGRGVGLWGVGTGGVDDKPLGEKPGLCEVVLGRPGKVEGLSDMKQWRPTSTYLHPTNLPPNQTSSTILPGTSILVPNSTISTTVLILLPDPSTPFPLDSPPSPSQSPSPTNIHGSTIRNIEDPEKLSKVNVEHIENVHLPTSSSTGIYPPQHPVIPSQADPGDEEEDLEDLPDFVIGVVTLTVVADEGTVGGNSVGQGNVVPSPGPLKNRFR